MRALFLQPVETSAALLWVDPTTSNDILLLCWDVHYFEISFYEANERVFVHTVAHTRDAITGVWYHLAQHVTPLFAATASIADTEVAAIVSFVKVALNKYC